MPPPIQPIGDSFAPFFTVKFLTYEEVEQVLNEDGERVPAGAAEGGAASEGVTLEFTYGDKMRSYAASLEILHKGEIGSMAMATVVFSPPFEDAIAIVDDRTVQKDSLMVIEWGWLASDGGKVLASGRYLFMIAQPSLEMSNTDFTITIVGTDLFGYSAPRREDRRNWKRTVYPSDHTILKEIVAKNNLHIDLDQVARDSPLFAQRPSGGGDPDKLEQNEKDWVFFQKVCASNNCSFYTIGNRVYIVDKTDARTKAPAYNLLFFRQPKTNVDIALLTFSTNAEGALFFPAASNETTVNHTDLDTGEVRQARYNPRTMPDQQSLGELSSSGKDRYTGRSIDVRAPAVRFGVVRRNPEFQERQLVGVTPRPSFSASETGEVLSLPGALANREETGKQVARTAHVLANTSAKATMSGAPGLVPQMIVRVECGSKVFSGSYIVREVVHTLNMGGYETSVKLRREASSGDLMAGIGARPANPNEKEPETDPTGEVPPTLDADGESLPFDFLDIIE